MVRIGSGNGDEIESQAAAWAILCAERPLTDQEQQQLDGWIGANSRHLGALIRAQAIWSDVDRVVALELSGTIVVGIIAVQSILTDQRALLDVAIGLALVSFLGTVAFARYVGKGGTR